MDQPTPTTSKTPESKWPTLDVCNGQQSSNENKKANGVNTNYRSKSMSLATAARIAHRAERSKQAFLVKRRQREKEIANERRRVQRQFFTSSTLHGVADLYREPLLYLKCAWAVILTGALCGAIWGCYSIVRDYQKSPLVVSYFVQEADSMYVPDVIVCPFNRFNSTFLDAYNVSQEVRQYLEMAFPSPTLHEFQKPWFSIVYSRLDELEAELNDTLDAINMTFTQFVEAAALRCSAVMQSLKPLDTECNDITQMTTSAGRCFRVHGTLQKGHGFGYGNRIKIHLPHEHYQAGFNQIIANGVAVKLAERDRGVNTDLLFIPSGVHAIISLKATKYEFMNDEPRYQCRDNSDSDYSQLWCFEQCIMGDAEQQCGCNLVASSRPTLPFCTASTYVRCFWEFIRSANESDCRHRCRAPCSYMSYEPHVSYALFPSPEAAYFLSPEEVDTTMSYLSNDILLEVFYERLEYTTIRHVVSMTVDGFIAQIGGQVSLWVGGSIITVAQIGLFAWRYMSTWLLLFISGVRRVGNAITNLLPTRTTDCQAAANDSPHPRRRVLQARYTT